VTDGTSHPGQQAAPMLAAEGVDVRYGEVVALQGVNLAAARGECLALVGESGSGKTTLLRCFNRMVEPSAGVVRREGRDVQDLDPVALRRATGYVPQEGGLLPHWRVRRNAAMVPWLDGMANPEAAAAKALRLVGLDPDQFGSRWPRELSGGQRQRVAIARALASQPEVLLLDEPFGALDAITRFELQEVFRELQRSLGVTAVLVTHDLHEAMALAHQVAVLHHGRLEQVATPAAMQAQPATDYVARLLERARIRR
jgi:osmoprotectant transport system ATP-binding protein